MPCKFARMQAIMIAAAGEPDEPGENEGSLNSIHAHFDPLNSDEPNSILRTNR